MLDVIKDIFFYYPIPAFIMCLTCFYIAQWIRLIRRKTSDDISLVSIVANLINNLGYFIYGIWYATSTYVAVCIGGVIASTIYLFLVLHYRTKPWIKKKQPKHLKTAKCRD